MVKDIIIVDLFKNVSDLVNAKLAERETDPFVSYFSYGHYAEVTKNLTQADRGVTTKGKKYPLIWLVMDFVERKGAAGKDYYAELPDLQILIATGSDAKSDTPQRYEQKFKTVLYPVYGALLEAICDSSYFTAVAPDDIPHEKIDRPYWGGQDTQNNGAANLFNDFIDAIQIRKLQLFVNQNCY
jgi:hypothetical protein